MKFQICRHGHSLYSCDTCQMICFLLVQFERKELCLVKDVNKLIFGLLKTMDEDFPCDKCGIRFEYMYGVENKELYAVDCASTLAVFDTSEKTSIYAEYGSRYDSDHFFFIGKEGFLSPEKVSELYGLKHKIWYVICDSCVTVMIASGELSHMSLYH